MLALQKKTVSSEDYYVGRKSYKAVGGISAVSESNFAEASEVTILNSIGEGRFSQVFRGTYRNSLCALKEVHTLFEAKREFEFLNRLRSDYVCEVYCLHAK